MSDNTTPLSEAEDLLRRTLEENEYLRESIDEVRAMIDYEDRFWQKLGASASGDRLEGLEVNEIQDIEKKISPRMAGQSLTKRAVDLHTGFVFGQGWFIEGTAKPRTGRPSKARQFYANPVNQESLFSPSAVSELQKARFATGNVLVACNPRTREVHRIPFNQIKSVKVDPDFPEQVYAYLREWDTHDGTNDPVKRRWYYTYRYQKSRPKSHADPGDSGKRIMVDQEHTIVDLRANRQLGHVLGVPDGLAGYLWAETYSRVLNYGETVQEALSKILFSVTNKSKKGAQQAGVRMSTFDEHGGAASMVEGQELAAVSTAGRGYDYASARPLAAMAASAWNVSNMDLLNDSSAAGSSYGSAQALVGGNRNAMLLMQQEWAQFYKEIFRVVGLDSPRITFEPFESPDTYREAQSLTLLSPTLSDEEYRMKALNTLDIVADASEIPDTLKMRSEPQATAAQQGSPDQGVSNGTGGIGQGANDQRTDKVSNESLVLLNQMQNDDFLRDLSGLVERLENAIPKS